jgi:hypothetical protein
LSVCSIISWRFIDGLQIGIFLEHSGDLFIVFTFPGLAGTSCVSFGSKLIGTQIKLSDVVTEIKSIWVDRLEQIVDDLFEIDVLSFLVAIESIIDILNSKDDFVSSDWEHENLSSVNVSNAAERIRLWDILRVWFSIVETEIVLKRQINFDLLSSLFRFTSRSVKDIDPISGINFDTISI